MLYRNPKPDPQASNRGKEKHFLKKEGTLSRTMMALWVEEKEEEKGREQWEGQKEEKDQHMHQSCR